MLIEKKKLNAMYLTFLNVSIYVYIYINIRKLTLHYVSYITKVAPNQSINVYYVCHRATVNDNIGP